MWVRHSLHPLRGASESDDLFQLPLPPMTRVLPSDVVSSNLRSSSSLPSQHPTSLPKATKMDVGGVSMYTLSSTSSFDLVDVPLVVPRSGPTTILSLPLEITSLVFFYLSPRQAISLAVVCSHFLEPSRALLWSYIHTPTVLATNRLLSHPFCGRYSTEWLRVYGRLYYCSTKEEREFGQKMLPGNLGNQLEELVEGFGGVRRLLIDTVDNVDPMIFSQSALSSKHSSTIFCVTKD